MGFPISILNSEQKTWYAEMLIAAILADDEISASEVDFLKYIADIIKETEEKKRLLGMIGTKQKPKLYVPENTSKEILSAVYLELIAVIISDVEFTAQERRFLEEVAELFRFNESSRNKMMDWAEEGLRLNKQKTKLVRNGTDHGNSLVPIDKLSSPQKTWYAGMLVSAIMLDRQLDDYELGFLKVALGVVDNPKDRQLLSGHVRNKMALPLKEPPGISSDILSAIFIEIIQILAIDDEIGIKEHTHLQQVARLCRFSEEQFQTMLNWCNKGIEWKQSKAPLIKNCQLKPRINRIGGKVMEDNTENSALQNRYFQCFICESENKFPGFFLKQQSQETRQNVFGITTYHAAQPGFDFIDYNLVSIIICPYCYFAAKDKTLFKKDPSDKLPEVLQEKRFKQVWLSEIAERKRFFKHPDEISSVKRSLETAIVSYKMAIEIAKKLGELKQDDEMRWQVIHLLMVLAEINVSRDNAKIGFQGLIEAAARAKDLFNNSVNNSITFKCARLLVLFGLFKGEPREAAPYLDYLRETKNNKIDHLNPADKLILNKVLGETKRAVENKSEYHRDHLQGFHLID